MRSGTSSSGWLARRCMCTTNNFRTGRFVGFGSRPSTPSNNYCSTTPTSRTRIQQHSRQQQRHRNTTNTSRRCSCSTSSAPEKDTTSTVFVRDLQHFHRLETAKRRVRPDWSLERWSREGYPAVQHSGAGDASIEEWPSIHQQPSKVVLYPSSLELVIEQSTTTTTATPETKARYHMNEPAILHQDLKLAWPNVEAFSIENLVARYGNCEFCVGSDDRLENDDEDDDVTLTLDDYLAYAARDCDGDDSPLYIFDDWILQKDNDDADHDRNALKNAYAVPKQFFPHDYMSLLTTTTTTTINVRPPYCWLLIGAPRTGTALHVDPNATAAWNTLVSGRKRWFIFSPECGLSGTKDDDNNDEGSSSKDDYHVVVANPASTSNTVVSDSAIHWYYQQYPTTVSELMSMSNTGPQPHHRWYDFVQHPGETVYVPPGWSHAVINLELSVAVTHNFVGPHNVEAALAMLRQEDPDTAAFWHQELLRHGLIRNQ